MHPSTKAAIPPGHLRRLLSGGAAILLLFPFACCAEESPPPATRPVAKAPVAAAPKFRFEPARRDHDDMAVGETLVERIALVADEPVEWGDYSVATSCECLGARFIGEKTPTRAEVELSVFGHKLEDIDGRVLLLDAKSETILQFKSQVVVTRKPFVQPREVFIDRGPEGRFEIVVGQAFAHQAKPPEVILPELGDFDETKLILYELGDCEREHTDECLILRTKLTFIVDEVAQAKPFEAAIPITFGEPPLTRSVKVHWPGK